MAHRNTHRHMFMSGAVCLFCAIMLMSLSSCRHKEKEYVIALSQCSEDIWRDKINREMLMSTYLYENVSLLIENANDDSKRQIEQIDGFTARGVDLLIVAPNQVNTITPAIERAYEKGIPVVMLDRKAGTEKYTAFIGADNVEMGRVMGEYVAGQLGGRGRVAEITGLKGSSPAIERHRGFAEAIGRHKGVSLVAVESGNWLGKSGEKAMRKILKDTGGDIDYVFAHNDRMAAGARRVAESSGQGRKIKFVGIDALSGKGGGLQMVKSGELDASYIYPTRGDLVIRLAMSILTRRPYARDNLIKAVPVTRYNIDALLTQADETAALSKRLDTLHGMVDKYFAQYSHQRIYLILIIIITVLLTIIFVAAYRVIVVRRRMAEDAAAAKLRFFTNVSHEFRTPLTLIADPVDRMLADGSLTAEQRQMLGLVKSNAAMLLRLVGEILDFRKVQSGKTRMDVCRFNLSEKVAEWTDNFRGQALRRDLSVETDVAGGIIIEADLHKVERIFYNLMSNAIKYNRAGGSVSVALRAGGESAVLSVADTGIGIPHDKMPHVFERFFRVNENVSGGTGIGLALVKAFAEMHGGTVAVAGRDGGGTVFTVSLPLRQQGADVADMPDSTGTEGEATVWGGSMADSSGEVALRKITAGGGDDPKPLVLVVDDNTDVRAYITDILSPEYDVKGAADGREGLDTCLKSMPDLVICDVMMPVMDGLEMCRRVKADAQTSRIPVVLLTARAVEGQRAEGYDCGADAYITKPFSSGVLLSRVRNLIESRRKLMNAFSGSAPESARPDDPDTRFIADFREILRKRLSDSSLNVEDIAAELGISRVQMYRKVKQLTGSSPVEIIRITRLKTAERLLKTTTKTVSEVSYEVGFSSPSYFAKCFKDLFGRLPGARE